MARKLTSRELSINEYLKWINKKALLAKEYDELKKQGKDVNLSNKTIFTDENKTNHVITEYMWEGYIAKGVSVLEIEILVENMYHTESFFGIDFDENLLLLSKIASQHYFTDDSLQEKYTEWKNYCSFVDAIPSFIKTNYIDFDKNQKKYRELFENNAKLYAHNGFWEDISSFFDNCNLNQINKAKTKKLKELGFPKISTLKIAEELTSLFNNSTSPN